MPSPTAPVIIIGAGISGLTFAHGLQKANIPFQVFERDRGVNARGQGYHIRVNGEDDYTRIEATCAHTKLGGGASLNAITGELNPRQIPTPRHGVLPLIVDRTVLRTQLLKGLEEFVSFNKEFKAFTLLETGGMIVHFTDDTSTQGSLLVGADGARSRVTREYLPFHLPIDTEGRCIFGKTPLTPLLSSELDLRALAGMCVFTDSTHYIPLGLLLEPIRFKENEYRCELPEDYIYWVLFSRKDHPSDINTVAEIKGFGPDAAKLSRNLTSHWIPSIHPLFAHQDESQTGVIRVSSFKPTLCFWEPRASVTLIGDAVHAMSPTAGIGANTALKGAALLVKILGEEGILKESIGKYEVSMREFAGEAIEKSGTGVIAATDSSRPRGVSPEFAKFYKATDSFTCISNPSIKIDVSQVNDDYCDCPDGSDEPGTAACSYLSDLSPPATDDAATSKVNITLALPGFYCKNKGHQASYIPFQYVNDGICDYELCCDGSDEFDHVGSVTCPNKCKEIGKEWRKLGEQRQKSMANAIKKKKEFVTQAQRLRKEVEDRIQSLTAEVEVSKLKVASLEGALEEAERQEKSKVIKDPEGGSPVQVLAKLAKERVEELRGTLTEVKSQRDALRNKVMDLEMILGDFKAEYNPNFNDEGVKRAVQKWEDYSATSALADPDFALEQDIIEIMKPDSETGVIDWDEWEKGEEESDIELLYKFEAYLPPSLQDWIGSKLRQFKTLLEENGILASTPKPSGAAESKALQDARAALKTAETSLDQTKTSLIKENEDLNKDYGPSDIFRALKNSCISRDSGEYTYELCFFGRTSQKPKKGGGDTNMGNFVRFDKIQVDDGPVPADGKGLGSGERWAMRYENGQSCWNGPQRSTLVILGCAEEGEVWKVVEEEKCVYRMEVGTPAVCESSGGNESGKIEKDEL
ncbi:MAG: hypothetical protein MMC33_005670 [Icmadophila ericetorum]|nr:hypothetical protein [Icmadophila ericetorum]